jgi:uncharacterized protein (TIGR02646 family)
MPVFTRRSDIPVLDNFQEYKPYLRQDFHYVCVYCRVHENELGGPRIFTVEHYRPKDHFPYLLTDYTNLLYACAVCNSFKREDWHDGDPLTCEKGYLDPCQHDYDMYFSYTAEHKIEGRISCARYMIKRLRLNRRQLIKLRRLRIEEEQEFTEFIELCEDAIHRIAAMLCRRNLSDDAKRQFESQLDSVQAKLRRKAEKWERRWEPRFNLEDYRS